MVVKDAEGNDIAAAGGKFGKPYDEKTIDGEPITQELKLITLKRDWKDGDDPLTKFPKSLKIQKTPDNRTKLGYRLTTPLKIRVSKILTVGAASTSGQSPSIIRHNEELKIIPLDVLRIRMMTDPYNFSIRRLFSDSVFQDPTIAPALQKRNKAFYSNGFYMDLELKSMINPASGLPYTPEETQNILSIERQKYLTFLLQLDTWSKLPTIDVLDKMKRSHISVIAEGRALNLIVPKPDDLQNGELPISVRNITWENTGQVYVDTIYWQIVGVRLFFINKDMASPDEMVYITGKNYGLRWLSDFYGASEIEPFIQMSRINRMILNYHLAKATENAYMSKIILSTDVQGDPATKKQQIDNLIQSIISQGMDIMGIEYRVTPTVVPVSADSELMDMIIKTLDDRLISGMGSTRAQMGRTENLNRDTATIMEVENIRNVRTPDEELIGNGFATQLFDPLLAHLANQNVEEIPVRVVIKRIEPTDEAIDPDLENKLAELKGASEGKPGAGGGLVQEDSGGQGMEGTKSFGAAKKSSAIFKREFMLTKLNVPRGQICKILLDEFGPKTLGSSAENAAANDDDSTDTEDATIEDVKAWASIPNSVMMLHYLNPNRWDDRSDYEEIAANAKNFDSLSKDQQIIVIRGFYFRNPGQNVGNILADYGIDTPEDPSAFCWEVLTPSMKQHLIDPEQKLSWSIDFVKTPYDKLNPQLKDIADRLYVWRHTPHDAENLAKLDAIPEFPTDLKKE